MAKALKAKFPEKCIKCELCIMEAQRQLNKVGLEGALIRVFRNTDTKTITYSIDIDPRIKNFDVKEIKEICPTGVFSMEEEEESGFLS